MRQNKFFSCLQGIRMRRSTREEQHEVLNHITEEFFIQILVEKSSDTSGAGWIEHWGIPVFSKVR